MRTILSEKNHSQSTLIVITIFIALMLLRHFVHLFRYSESFIGYKNSPFSHVGSSIVDVQRDGPVVLCYMMILSQWK